LGSDTELFSEDPASRIKYRKELNIDDDALLVVYTGKIYEVKNVHLIIDALNELLGQLKKQVVIHLVGDISTSYLPLMKEKMANSQIRVIHTPALPVSKLPAVYNAADLAVWPDHLTNSTIDASACGCPVICSDYMSERVKFGNGLLVKGGDLESLKQALVTMIEDDKLRKEMGRNGIDYVNQELSWLTVARKFLE